MSFSTVSYCYIVFVNNQTQLNFLIIIEVTYSEERTTRLSGKGEYFSSLLFVFA